VLRGRWFVADVSSVVTTGVKSDPSAAWRWCSGFVPHYNLVFYRKTARLLAASIGEFLYGEHPGHSESGLATEAPRLLPTRRIRNVPIGSALWQTGP